MYTYCVNICFQGQTTSSDNNPRDNFGCTPKPAPENKDKPSTDKNKLDPSTNTNKRGTVEPFTNLSTEKSAVNKKVQISLIYVYKHVNTCI